MLSISENRLSRAKCTFGVSRPYIYKKAIRLADRLERPLSVCDLGAGSGNLLHALSSLWPDTKLTGVDLLPRPTTLCESVKWIQADLDDDTLSSDQFDLVFSLEVIEHLENPRRLVRELSRILKPGGAFILSTPNNHSIRSLVSFLVRGVFADFSDYHYPKHISPVLIEDLKRICFESELKVGGVSFTDKGFFPGADLLWQNIIPFLKGRLFSDNVFVFGNKNE